MLTQQDRPSSSMSSKLSATENPLRRPGTPVKSSRPSTMEGGLMPLPPSDDLVVPLTVSSAKNHEHAQDYGILDEERVLEDFTGDATEENEAREQLMETTEPTNSGVTAIHNSAEDELSKKISAGLEKIKKLDEVLKEKMNVAKTLKQQRVSRERGIDYVEAGDDEEEEEDDDNQSILQSVHSYNTRTFITEPKFKKKHKSDNAQDADDKAEPDVTENETSTLNTSKKPPKPKTYQKGDFIQRNIVLGGEARYYHAMTEEEQSRVETLVNQEDEEILDDCQSVTNDAAPSIATTRTNNKTHSGFFPEDEDLDKLAKIDNELQKIIPPSKWDSSSVIWSSFSDITSQSSRLKPSHSSLFPAWQSDKASSVTGAQPRKKTADMVMVEPMELVIEDDMKRMQEIDLLLENMKKPQETNGDEEPSVAPVALSREVLDALLNEAKRYDEEMKSCTTSEWDLESISSRALSSSRATTPTPSTVRARSRMDTNQTEQTVTTTISESAETTSVADTSISIDT